MPNIIFQNASNHFSMFAGCVNLFKNMMQIKLPLTLAIVFLWIGFVCAISFMEAWLKFRAPGITLPLGLGIGRLVFNALNKVEWVFAISIVLSIVFDKQGLFQWQYLFFLVPLVLLLLQTFWLLPVLDARAEMHIQGQTVPPSNMHFYYVGAEAVKVLSLLGLGISLFK